MRLRNWAKLVQHMKNVQVSCFTHSIIIELQVDFRCFPKYRSIMCAAFLGCVLVYKVFSMISTETASHLSYLKHEPRGCSNYASNHHIICSGNAEKSFLFIYLFLLNGCSFDD